MGLLYGSGGPSVGPQVPLGARSGHIKSREGGRKPTTARPVCIIRVPIHSIKVLITARIGPLRRCAGVSRGRAMTCHRPDPRNPSASRKGSFHPRLDVQSACFVVSPLFVCLSWNNCSEPSVTVVAWFGIPQFSAGDFASQRGKRRESSRINLEDIPHA